MLSFNDKVDQITQKFASCNTPNERYQIIIAMGKDLKPFPIEKKLPENQVLGCQSTLFIDANFTNNCLEFSAFSDALISAGLASILLFLYNGESPESVLKNKPTFLKDIGILSSLSPTRANGFANLYLKMQKIALHALATQ